MQAATRIGFAILQCRAPRLSARRLRSPAPQRNKDQQRKRFSASSSKRHAPLIRLVASRPRQVLTTARSWTLEFGRTFGIRSPSGLVHYAVNGEAVTIPASGEADVGPTPPMFN